MCGIPQQSASVLLRQGLEGQNTFQTVLAPDFFPALEFLISRHMGELDRLREPNGLTIAALTMGRGWVAALMGRGWVSRVDCGWSRWCG